MTAYLFHAINLPLVILDSPTIKRSNVEFVEYFDKFSNIVIEFANYYCSTPIEIVHELGVDVYVFSFRTKHLKRFFQSVENT